jgi:hypothetical protein
MGLTPASADTGAYCKARKRLPQTLLSRLAKRVGWTLSNKADADKLWLGRRVKVVDGSSVSMPDTLANQKAYPQPANQKPGCGFPVVAFVAVFCLGTGAMLDLAFGPWYAHDLRLFYFVRKIFVLGDIMLGDRAFGSYAELALLRRKGVDTVVRLHQARGADFRRGRILGRMDHCVAWPKPKKRPKGLRREDYRLLPETMPVRELKYSVQVKGFRTKAVTLATTLLDSEKYSAQALAELYFARWDVELNFQHIKTTMKMDILRGRTPAMVRKEILTYMLAYNLVRSVMWDAAAINATPVRRLSFKGTIQYAMSMREISAPPGQALQWLLEFTATQKVPYRPWRIEPRVRKRRPKKPPLMMKPRSQLKAGLGA